MPPTGECLQRLVIVVGMACRLGKERPVFEMLDLSRRVTFHHRADIDAAMAANQKIVRLGAELIADHIAWCAFDITDASVGIAHDWRRARGR